MKRSSLNSSAFRCEVEKKKKLIEGFLKEPNNKDRKEKWLTLLYKTYFDRMLSDNQRIWTTAAIFIPVALAGFGAYASLSPVTLDKALLLALASCFLICFWLIIAEHHRTLRNKSEAWTVAIRETVTLEDSESSKLVINWMNLLGSFPRAAQITGYFLAVVVTMAWAVIIFYLAETHMTEFTQGLSLIIRLFFIASPPCLLDSG